MKISTKAFIFLVASFYLSSCATSFKSGDKSGVFLKDSDFLKQEYEIKQADKEPEKELKKELKKEVKHENTKKIKNVHVKKQNKKSHADIKLQPKKKAEKETLKSDDRKKTKKEVEQERLDNLFPEGEMLELSASFFGVEAGRVQIGIKSDKLINGSEARHFYALGKTSSLFSLVYKVRDRIESLWSQKLERPLTLAFDVDETKQKYKTRSYFNWKTQSADYFEEGWHKKKGEYQDKKTWMLPNKGQDIVSAIFFVRTLPLIVGESYTFNVMEDEKVIETTLKVEKREILNTHIGKISSLLLKPTFKTKGKFKQVGDISIWVTDDKYKQILRVDSKIKIGTVSAKVLNITRPHSRL